jgi:hypothetical protein
VNLTTEKGGMEVVFGECELSVGDEPNKEAAIAAATAATPATPAPEPAKASSGGPQGKKKGQADAGWEDKDGDDEGGGKRRRSGTQPPPMS